ncbi:hypothetical protein C3486_28550 [Streptomyces sp. Ru73]|nr:hypothetical protein C3486_28550 [Streptomyces sp. Ru73]
MGSVVLGALLSAVLEMTVLATVPRAGRPILVGALAGAVTVVCVVVAAVVPSHHRARRGPAGS